MRRTERWLACGWAAAALLALPQPARSALGQGEASIQVDQLRAAAARHVSAGPGPQVHTLTLADGGTIRQYLAADGRVFAVAWNTHTKPRLDLLLGAHFADYAALGRSAMQRRAGVLHRAAVQGGDLVVEATAHLNAHVGRAWLRSLVPAGMPTDVIR